MSTRATYTFTFLLAGSLASGCAEDIGFDEDGLALDDGADDEDDEAATSEDGGEPAGKITHEPLGGGVVRTTVDASDEAGWVYLDLDTQAELAEGEAGWDIGFRRFDMKLAGGISGDAGVEATFLDAADFAALTEAPADAVWITDAPDGDDEGEEPDLALGDWYDYDFMTHTLTPKDRVYLIRTSEGAVIKLQIADYYSEAGTSGFPKFYWAAVEG